MGREIVMEMDINDLLKQLGVNPSDLDDCARCDEDIELPKTAGTSMPIKRGL